MKNRNNDATGEKFLEKRPIQNRFLILDGLRGLAAFAVAGLHIYFWQIKALNGIIFCVDFFFVLSGFVLASSILKKNRSVKKFLFSRAIRVYPAILVSFFLVGLIYFLPLLNSTTTARKFNFFQYVLAFLLLQVFIPGIYWINHPLWSLSAELFINICAIILPTKRSHIYFYLSIGFVLQLLSYINFGTSWNDTRNHSPLGRVILGFYLGILIGHDQVNQRRGSKFSSKNFSFVSFFVILEFILLSFSYKFLIFASPIFYFLIREIIKFDQNTLPQRIKSSCAYLGRISYGVYVFHLPIHNAITGRFLVKYLGFDLSSPMYQVLGFFIKIFVTWGITVLSLKFIENPLKRLVDRKSV